MLSIGQAGYKVQVLKNGSIIDKFILQRVHHESNADVITLMGIVKTILKKDDTISIQIVPQENVDSKKRKYKVLTDGTILTIKREEVFG